MCTVGWVRALSSNYCFSACSTKSAYTGKTEKTEERKDGSNYR